MILHTDDILVISDNGEKVLRGGIGNYFELKESSIGPPNHYMGGHTRKVELTNGVHAWAFSYSRYVTEAVNNVDRKLCQKRL